MSNNNNSEVNTLNDGDGITKIATTVLGESSTSGTTSFTEQNPTNLLRVVSDAPHSREIVDSSVTCNIDQSLKSFMAKPIILASGSITSANLSGTQVFKFSVLASLQTQPLWANKISGFMNVRGTARIRLQVNANPFQAGRLILCYIPQYSHSPRSFTTHLQDLICISQLPHVEMSLQDTECELEIPYIAPTTHCNMLSGQYDWGTVFCYIYSPLATGSGGTNQVTYTAWMSFDDFEFEVPIVAQSSNVYPTKKNIIRKYRVNAIKSNLDSEVNEGKGPISSILSNVSSIATTLYSVPMLMPIAGPAAWATNLLSGVASSFGWSKPVIDSNVARFASNPHAYLANTNAADLTNNLALIADNKVEVMPDVNLSGVDEMSHAFIKRQRSFVSKVNWTTTTLPGPLQAFEVSPGAYRNVIGTIPVGATSKVVVSNMPPITLLAQLYKYWRGSLEFTFKIVKTQYHTGRLLVSFNPALVTAPISNANTAYLHREVIDLRDGNEFQITIPYCYNAMYMPTNVSDNDVRMMMQISVLNELVAPETCAQAVEIILEVRGGKDLEFQVPIPFRMAPTQMIEPQSGGDSQAQPVLVSTIGSSIVHEPSKKASAYCIGEHSTSLLQLMKRYSRLSTSVAAFTTQNKLNIYPFYWGGYYTTGVVSAGTESALTNDYLGLFASFYAHSRGGVRYRIVSEPPGSSDATVGSILSSYVPFSPAISSPYSAGTANTEDTLVIPLNQQISNRVTNGTYAFDGPDMCGTMATYPHYGRTFTRLNRIFFDNSTNNTALSPNTAPDISLQWLQFVTSATTFGANLSLFRCASDDFQFSMWLGVPTVGFMTPA